MTPKVPLCPPASSARRSSHSFHPLTAAAIILPFISSHFDHHHPPIYSSFSPPTPHNLPPILYLALCFTFLHLPISPLSLSVSVFPRSLILIPFHSSSLHFMFCHCHWRCHFPSVAGLDRPQPVQRQRTTSKQAVRQAVSRELEEKDKEWLHWTTWT